MKFKILHQFEKKVINVNTLFKVIEILVRKENQIDINIKVFAEFVH